METLIRHNEKLNGIEIVFDGKPDVDILSWIKSHGFRYSKFNNWWWRKYSVQEWTAVHEYLKQAPPDKTPEPTTGGFITSPSRQDRAMINVHKKGERVHRNTLRSEMVSGKLLAARRKYFDGMTDSSVYIQDKDLVWTDKMDDSISRAISSDYYKGYVSEKGIISKDDYIFKYKDTVIIPESYRPQVAGEKDFYVNLELAAESGDYVLPKNQHDELTHNEGDKVEAEYDGRKICGVIIKKNVSRYTIRHWGQSGTKEEERVSVTYTVKLDNGVTTTVAGFMINGECSDTEPIAIYNGKEYIMPDRAWSSIHNLIKKVKSGIESAARRKKESFKKTDLQYAENARQQLFKEMSVFMAWENENKEFTRKYITGETEEAQEARLNAWVNELGIKPSKKKDNNLLAEIPVKQTEPIIAKERPSAFIHDEADLTTAFGKLMKKHGVREEGMYSRQLLLGQLIESEHTNDKTEALRIAFDHVWENPDYYIEAKPVNWAEKELEKRKPKFKVGDYVRYEGGDVVKEHWSGIVREVKDFGSEYAYRVDAYAVQDNRYVFDPAKNNEKYEAQLHELISISTYEKLKKNYEKQTTTKIETGKSETENDDTGVSPLTTNLTTDEAAELFKDYGLNEKQSILLYELGNHGKGFGLAGQPKELVGDLLKKGYIHPPTYKYTGMSVITNIGRDVYNEAIKANIEKYTESQKPVIKNLTGVGSIRPSFMEDLNAPIIKGRKIEISMPNGEKRKGQFIIAELDNIIASHDEETFHSSPEYPKNAAGNNINDRNYKDDLSAQKAVMDYARDLEPERLITTSRTPSGTPIVTKDGFVVSGNNRTMSLKLAAKNYPDNYKSYIDFLGEEIEAFGFDKITGIALRMKDRIPLPGSSFHNPLSVKFEKPVLLRVDYDFPEYTTQELAKYNKDTKKSERPVDKAIKLSNILRENERCADIIAEITGAYDTFTEFYANIAGQKKLARTLVDCNLLTDQELPAYFSDTTFTEAGKEFIENILAALILDRDALLATEQPGVKATRQKLITSLPVLMKNASLPEGSLKQNINDAVILQQTMKASGSEFADFIRQQNLFGTKYDRKTVYMNRLIDSGKNKFKAAIEGYNAAIIKNQGASLFGDKPSNEEIFDHWIKGGVSETDQRLIEGSELIIKQPETKFEANSKQPEWLFIGIYPTGQMYADRRIEKNGEYHRIAFVFDEPIKDGIRVKVDDDSKPEYKSLIEVLQQDYDKTIRLTPFTTPMKDYGKYKIKTVEDFNVMGVDGEAVRKDHIEFTMAGHGYVYDYIPKNEIWIDEILLDKPDDAEATLRHELFELKKMRDEGLTYDQAHELANEMETKLRNDKYEYFYTTAPEAYDGFGTGTEEVTDFTDQSGKPVRKIHVEKTAIEWQKNRNLSGNHITASEKEFKEFKDNIGWFKKKEPVKSAIGVQPKTFAKLKKNYLGLKKGTIGEVKGSSDKSVTNIFFEEDPSIKMIDNTYLEFIKEEQKQPEPQTAHYMIDKFVILTEDYSVIARGSIGKVISIPNAFVAEIYFGKNQSGQELINKVDNRYYTYLKETPKIYTSGKSEKYVLPETSETIIIGTPDTIKTFAQKIKILEPFINHIQLDILAQINRGAEEQAAEDIVDNLAEIIEKMPKTNETQNIKSADQIIYLHYFASGSSNWYIVEKDKGQSKEDEERAGLEPGQQHQAFGYAILNGDEINAEWGFISIYELIKNNVELDFYWTPKKFSEVIEKKARQADIEPETKQEKLEFSFEPENNEGKELLSELTKYDITHRLTGEAPNEVDLIYGAEGKRYNLLDNGGEFKLYKFGTNYPEVIEFRNIKDDQYKSIELLASEIGAIIWNDYEGNEEYVKKKAKDEKALPSYNVGDRVSYTDTKRNRTVEGTIIERINDSECKVKFNTTIPGLFTNKVQNMPIKMLTIIKPAIEPETKRNEDIDLITTDEILLDDNGILFTLALQNLVPVKTQIPAYNLVNVANKRYKVAPKGLKLIQDLHNKTNSDLFAYPNQKYYIAAGNFIHELDKNPTALDYKQATGVDPEIKEPKAPVQELVSGSLDWYKNELRKAENLQAKISFTGDISRDIEKLKNKIKELELQSKPSLDELKTDFIKKISETKLASDIIAAEYKNDYERNKAIETILDRKWTDPLDEWSIAEKEFISNYSGYGGLDEIIVKAGGTLERGSLFEYYTPDIVIEKMWGLAYKYGYREGPIVEPSVGIGRFFNRKFVKDYIQKTGYETSKYSAKICKILYPEANINQGKDTMYFEQVFLKNNWTVKDNIKGDNELVIGNPPYGPLGGPYQAMGEKGHTNAKNYIEYFIIRGLDLLIPSGLLIYIIGVETAAGGTPWLDQGMSKAKEAIAEKADLIDAYRLPEGVFERTGVVSDIIVLRKKS